MVDVVNLHHVKNIQLWLTHPNHVYIGRETRTVQGSKWGNPFVISRKLRRKQAVQKYNIYICKNQELLQSLRELQGKTLGCWCVPRLCHGHILKRLVGFITTNKVCSHNHKAMATFECTTCGEQFPNTVDLQLHRINCGSVGVVRKSERKRSQTTKYAAYTRKLLDRESEGEEHDERKEATSKGEDMRRTVATKQGKEGKYVLEESEKGELETEVEGKGDDAREVLKENEEKTIKGSRKKEDHLGKEEKEVLGECRETKVEDQGTEKEGRNEENGSNEYRTIINENLEIPRNAAIHRSAEEIEKNRQEAILKRQQRSTQQEKEKQKEGVHQEQQTKQVEGNNSDKETQGKEYKEKKDEAQEEKEILKKTEEGNLEVVVDSPIDNIEDTAETEEETLLKKIAKKMEEIAKG